MKVAKWIGIGVLTFIVLVLLGKGVQQKDGSFTGGQDDVINIASYNIDSKDNPDTKKMIAQLKSKNIEVAGFQEIDKNNDRNNFDMLGKFKGEDYPFVHFAKGRDFANGEFGIGTISTIPLQETSTIPIDSSGGFATKTLERSVVKKGDKIVAVYNTHLSFESTELRKRQFFQILERVSSDPVPYKIIVGDFNADSNIYEYSMFLNEYNLVNGRDGKWLNSFRLPDAEMNVYTVDNIIATKNLEILDSGMVESDLSDHNMLFASLKLLDEKANMNVDRNIALGQKVTASSSYEKANQAIALPAMAVDNNLKTQWESAPNGYNGKQEELMMELDGNYDITEMSFIWGDNYATDYSILISSDGLSYSSYSVVKKGQPESRIKEKAENVRFIKLVLNKKEISDILKFRGYMLKEWQIFGTRSKNVNQAVYEGNILTDVLKLKENVEIDSTENIKPKITSNDISVLNKGKSSEKAQVVIKNIPVKSIADYVLSFDDEFKGQDTNSMIFEVFPRDRKGHVMMANYASVTDFLRKNGQSNHYEYNIHTASQVASLTIVFSISGGDNIGDINLKNVNLAQINPINDLQIEFTSTPKVNKSATAFVQSNVDNLGPLVWQSSDPSIMSVDDKGHVNFNKAGSVTLSAVLKNDPRYTVEKEFTVK